MAISLRSYAFPVFWEDAERGGCRKRFFVGKARYTFGRIRSQPFLVFYLARSLAYEAWPRKAEATARAAKTLDHAPGPPLLERARAAKMLQHALARRTPAPADHARLRNHSVMLELGVPARARLKHVPYPCSMPLLHTRIILEHNRVYPAKIGAPEDVAS